MLLLSIGYELFIDFLSLLTGVEEGIGPSQMGIEAFDL
jgi:hypothetical protein